MTFLSALSQKNHTGPIPVWFMRQAGRYLPGYSVLKKGRPLIDVFHDIEAIVSITQLPFKYLEVDAAILFSDILMILDCLGQEYEYQEHTGPVVAPIKKFFRKPVEEVYSFLQQAIQQLKKELQVPLIGFAGGPFTVACYLVEGKNGRDFKKTKQLMYQDPVRFSEIIDAITDATIDYLNLQVRAGVDALQIFDSWAGILDYSEFKRWSLGPLRKICSKFPAIVFCRGSSLFASEIADIYPAAISLDWCGDLPSIRSKLPNIVLQGNLDPMLLYAPRNAIAKEIDRILETMIHDPSYIFNLGHGILPDTPLETVQFVIDYVKNRSRPVKKTA